VHYAYTMSFILPHSTQLDAAADGDMTAWAEILDEVLPTVLGWCARLGGPSVDAEDAAHDVCLIALEKLAMLRDAAAFPAWLYGITRKVLATHRRRARWSTWMPMSVLNRMATPPDVDDLGGIGLDILEVLPEAQREALVLCGIEERTCEEAAALLGVPVGTIKSRLRLARGRFLREARTRGVLSTLEAHVPGA
jgi:DNA-directed RNA polymerase specialized sigma24 family protein